MKLQELIENVLHSQQSLEEKIVANDKKIDDKVAGMDAKILSFVKVIMNKEKGLDQDHLNYNVERTSLLPTPNLRMKEDLESVTLLEKQFKNLWHCYPKGIFRKNGLGNTRSIF